MMKPGFTQKATSDIDKTEVYSHTSVGFSTMIHSESEVVWTGIKEYGRLEMAVTLYFFF